MFPWKIRGLPLTYVAIVSERHTSNIKQDLVAHPFAPSLLLTDFRYGSPTGTDLLGKGLQQMLLGSKDAAGVSQDLDTGVKTWFKPSA